MARYRYELRRGDTITSTGHITYDAPLDVGDELAIGRSVGIVRVLGPRNPEGESTLLIQLLLDDSDGNAEHRGLHD